MIFDLNRLEFEKVLIKVKDYAQTKEGANRIVNLKPTNDAAFIMQELQIVDEFLSMIKQYASPPLGNVYDIHPHLKRVSLSGVLSAIELREVLMHLVVVNQNIRYKERLKSERIEAVSYFQIVNELVYVADLEERLRLAIDEDGNVLDTASQELSIIRKKQNATKQKIEEKLAQFLSKNGAMLSDALITNRNDRYVVPVKVENKNKIKGIIQDYSQSGETVFIEPTQIMELTNELANLKSKEQTEIERILRNLSGFVAEVKEELDANLEILYRLDFLNAKAVYADTINATKPKIGTQISLRGARHPLIPSEDVIANDLTFYNYKAVIITGPNTGGKTVAIKTLGLMALMTQCGMLIPVKEKSEIRIFDNIFADIGDEQSIEQSLSTFSSHMTNLVRITDKLTTDSLVLLDELGSGTDPKEGASLAVSIVEYIKKRGCYMMITTHYPELKAYAYSEDDTVNASTEFDIDTLSPTYKLSIGVPGRSNAFEISTRLGLNDNIIQHAKDHTASSETEVSTLIQKLEQETKQVDALKEQLLLEEARIQIELEKLANAEQELALKKNTFIQDAKREAKEYVDKIKQEANDIIAELKNKQNVKYHELVEEKTKLNQLTDSEVEQVTKDTAPLKKGDQVFVLPYQQSGSVLKVLPNQTYEIKMGMITTKLKRNQLTYVAKKEKQIQTNQIFYKRNNNVSITLDLRGYRYDEAMLRLEKYIDELLTAGLKQSTIIHGHGTNALKRGVHDFLSTSPYIERYEYAKEGEGGSGATNVYLK